MPRLPSPRTAVNWVSALFVIAVVVWVLASETADAVARRRETIDALDAAAGRRLMTVDRYDDRVVLHFDAGPALELESRTAIRARYRPEPRP